MDKLPPGPVRAVGRFSISRKSMNIPQLADALSEHRCLHVRQLAHEHVDQMMEGGQPGPLMLNTAWSAKPGLTVLTASGRPGST
jgi:hypothetical protein